MKFSNLARMSFFVVTLCATALFFSSLVGVLPDDRRIRAESRTQLCESTAAQLTYLVSENERDKVQRQIGLLCKRNSALVSLGVRDSTGQLIAEAGGHSSLWTQAMEAQSDGCYTVPIRSTTRDWGQLEYNFSPLYAGLARYVSPTLAKLLLVLTPFLAVTSWVYFRRSFRYLDPTRVVPGRVRQTLDSFVEGVLLLDQEGRIVLANEALTKHIDSDDLLGTHVSELDWLPYIEGTSVYAELKLEDETHAEKRADGSANKALCPPWEEEHCRSEAINGRTVVLRSAIQEKAVFSANTSPVMDEQGKFQGLMIAFADVTTLEQKRVELSATLDDLHQSKQEVSNQNVELRYLATRDALTGCINRRTFYESFDELWKQCENGDAQLNAMMVDIDFFKSINDTYGHSVGDDVLKATGKLLLESSGPEDIVCRYGGEEFAVLVPNRDISDAEELAERIRVRLSEIQFEGFTVTASLGVSSFELGAADPGDMLDQADKCLYVAKRNGRNQVVRFDTVPADLVIDESKISRTKIDDARKPAIPFPAVAALLSALSFRDAQTGAHSTRVANYAASMAQELLAPRDAYVVEIAGLLHDIGKIGIADAILLKPGKLTDEEWKDMHRHDVIGVELVRKSFAHDGLTEIVEKHHAWFDGSNTDEPGGENIPLGARILAIADSFDAMVSDRPYRKGMPVEQAIAELQRCSGTQFDPELVNVFERVIASDVFAMSDSAVNSSISVPNEVAVNLGEHIERVVEAIENGDRESFIALADRIRMTAEQNHIAGIAAAASHAVDVASEDIVLEELAHEAFELLRACRSIHATVADASISTRPLTEASVS